MWSRIRFFAPPEPSRPHQHARTIPQQTAIGRSVNIRLDYGGTFLLAPRPARAVTPARWLVPVASAFASGTFPSPVRANARYGRFARTSRSSLQRRVHLWFRYSDLDLSIPWFGPTPWIFIYRVSPPGSVKLRGGPGWTGELRWSYPSRYDESTSMAGERSEGLPEAGIHRRMDREAVLRAVPAERRRPVRESAKLGPARVLSKRIGGHHGNNGTPPIASGAGS